MNRILLNSLSQLDTVNELSRTKPVLIFKHSTSCSISRTSLDRLERSWTQADSGAHTAYYLDLLRHRDVSNAIAERYAVRHESPQTLVIRNGDRVKHAAHFEITYAGTISALAG